jgi:coat protein with S domain
MPKKLIKQDYMDNKSGAKTKNKINKAKVKTLAPNVTINAPAARSIRTVNNKPRMRQSGDTFTVTHREFIKDVSAASAGFNLSTSAINPGLASSFPWLSQIASRFESYIFDRLDFIYQPICNTTTPGSVMMAVDFDALDLPPADKVVFMANQNAVRCSPWDNVRYSSKPKNLHKFGIQRYVRTTAQPDKSDVKTYDVGNFLVGSTNTPAAPTTLGELYVEYTVRFFTPQIQTSIPVTRDSNTTQYGSFSVAKIGNDAAVALKSVIYTESNRPLMWIGAVLKEHILCYMNLKEIGSSILQLVSSTLPADMVAPVRLLAYYQNTPVGVTDATDYPYRMSEMAENTGFGWRQNINDALRTIYIRPQTSQDSVAKANGKWLDQADPFPLLFRRSPTTDFTYNFSIAQFAGSLDQYFITNSAQKLPLDYAYPDVIIPYLKPSSVNPTRSSDGWNEFTVKKATDPVEISTEDLTKSTSKLNLFSRFK